VQQRERALLREIIKKGNDLFEGELTDDDKLVYVNNVNKGKLLESATLKQQAANNTKEQFANPLRSGGDGHHGFQQRPVVGKNRPCHRPRHRGAGALNETRAQFAASDSVVGWSHHQPE
jgi:hypothetical protein